MAPPRTPGVRLSELVASLALATDIGMGQPMDHVLRTCLLSLGIAREAGLTAGECHDVYYLALLRFVGCNAHASSDATESGGDEMADRAGIGPLLGGDTREFVTHLFRHLGEGRPPLERARLVAGALAAGPARVKAAVAASCEVAQMLAGRLGLGKSLVSALAHSFEYWNGKGVPGKASGEEIPITARIAAVARDVDVLNSHGGPELVRDALKRRRGRAYDPRVADAFLEHAEGLLAGLDDGSLWDSVIEADPSPSPVTGSRVEEILACFADFADLKCAFTRAHSRAVSELAASGATSLGLPGDEVDSVRAAGLVQELGRTGIPNGILDKPGPLTPGEWERVRLHPYLTERVLARCRHLEPVAALASSHHERLDGSGYHRGSRGPQIPIGARLLGAADAYRALITARPHRPAHPPEQAARILSEEASAGRFDPGAVLAVLDAAGQRAPRARRAWPAGLSDREVEVLRLISLGRSNREVAETLVISPKTVGRHVENVYVKIGVSTRASAALYAMQHDLLD